MSCASTDQLVFGKRIVSWSRRPMSTLCRPQISNLTGSVWSTATVTKPTALNSALKRLPDTPPFHCWRWRHAAGRGFPVLPLRSDRTAWRTLNWDRWRGFCCTLIQVFIINNYLIMQKLFLLLLLTQQKCRITCNDCSAALDGATETTLIKQDDILIYCGFKKSI